METFNTFMNIVIAVWLLLLIADYFLSPKDHK